ncbi:hypothetical protein GCM10011391_37730 [Pullulanibacillus camelliae]|uniref:Uncharacterized protein n=1 Tax=Pullulanibacillus camelliae TaxID=1707096 RepID=A0A8J2YMK4_9BACL|nr:hypothetical protein GCM10011391_37730 [Pullulanibacillus camelliae]
MQGPGMLFARFFSRCDHLTSQKCIVMGYKREQEVTARVFSHLTFRAKRLDTLCSVLLII